MRALNINICNVCTDIADGIYHCEIWGCSKDNLTRTEKMKRFKNCTPHPITLLGENNKVLFTLPKGEVVPRLEQETRHVDTINGVNITETCFGKTEKLPNEELNTLLVVSRMILVANPDRKDLLVPNELVRDQDGNIVGCKSLARN